MDVKLVFDMVPWKLVLLGIASLVGLVVAVRVMRRGLSTFEQTHHSMEERIRKTRLEIDEKNKSTPTQDQLHLVQLAVQELIEMAGAQDTVRVQPADREILVFSPQGQLGISYASRVTHLHSNDKNLYGSGVWRVRRLADARSSATPGNDAHTPSIPPPGSMSAAWRSPIRPPARDTSHIAHIVVQPAPAEDATSAAVVSTPCAAHLQVHIQHVESENATPVQASPRADDPPRAAVAQTETSGQRAMPAQTSADAAPQHVFWDPQRTSASVTEHPAAGGNLAPEQTAAFSQELSTIDEVLRYVQRLTGLPVMEGPLPLYRTDIPRKKTQL